MLGLIGVARRSKKGDEQFEEQYNQAIIKLLEISVNKVFWRFFLCDGMRGKKQTERVASF